jgi:hypothetical protein
MARVQNRLGLYPGHSIHSRRLMVQRRVRPLGIVVHPPGLNGGTRFFERGTLVLIQALLSKSGIECLDEGIVDRCPRPATRQLHAITMRPGIQCPRRELWPMIDAQRLGPPVSAGQLLKHGHDSMAAQRSIDLDRWTLTGHVLHTREGATAAH